MLNENFIFFFVAADSDIKLVSWLPSVLYSTLSSPFTVDTSIEMDFLVGDVRSEAKQSVVEGSDVFIEFNSGATGKVDDKFILSNDYSSDDEGLTGLKLISFEFGEIRDGLKVNITRNNPKE